MVLLLLLMMMVVVMDEVEVVRVEGLDGRRLHEGGVRADDAAAAADQVVVYLDRRLRKGDCEWILVAGVKELLRVVFKL